MFFSPSFFGVGGGGIMLADMLERQDFLFFLLLGGGGAREAAKVTQGQAAGISAGGIHPSVNC